MVDVCLALQCEQEIDTSQRLTRWPSLVQQKLVQQKLETKIRVRKNLHFANFRKSFEKVCELSLYSVHAQ